MTTHQLNSDLNAVTALGPNDPDDAVATCGPGSPDVPVSRTRLTERVGQPDRQRRAGAEGVCDKIAVLWEGADGVPELLCPRCAEIIRLPSGYNWYDGEVPCRFCKATIKVQIGGN